MSKLVFEEKTWEIASNMDMVNRFQLCKMVTKNLLYLVHARRHFGITLDLNQHTSIIEAVTTHIKEFIVQERAQVKRETSAKIFSFGEKSIKKLFKRTLKKEYANSLLNSKKEDRWVSTLQHYTVHEFNEALYSSLKEYSSFINFA